MNKLKTFLCLAFVCVTCLYAQDAKTYFVGMPDSLCPILTAVNRADCVDFLESKMKAEVTNRFGAKSEMTNLSADYIRVQMSPESSWQMKLLATSDSTKVICTISTSCGPACDSDIRFYTTKWKELPVSSFLKRPVIADFLAIPDTVEDYGVRDAREKADMLLMKADFTAGNKNLTFSFTVPEYVGKNVADKLKPYLKADKVYRWKAGKFIAE